MIKLFNELNREYVETEEGPMLKIESKIVLDILDKRFEFLKSQNLIPASKLRCYADHLDDMEMKLINVKERWKLHD